MDKPAQPLVLASEFATVEVSRDDSGNGPRLLIRDLRTGRGVMLDPLELAALTWMRHDELAPFLDPSRFPGAGGPNGKV
ncbi:MAG: hypothetical protein ABSG46_10630 [Candidatus Binataceae bacterium]|jgi:hypothetical protein